ncbi:MarR family winged helix-turn-helix transcriptional regulator [Pseudonocardia sp.]|uniref:MarR family winged helix-turn-helix transcriptional regulator n=1 Tax=Pseudonocardia sp. TaxID=60912 RepID=UPI003D112E72
MRPPGTPEERHPGLDAKIVAGLDRIGEALGVLARRAAEAHDLSVTQMRLLARLAAGPPPDATTSALARELDVTDPTVSDAFGALRRKGLVEREQNPHDRRQYHLRLTPAGREVAAAVARWTAPAEMLTARIGRTEAEQLLAGLLEVLGRLCAGGLVDGVRACSTCRHLRPGDGAGPPYRCALFDVPMGHSDLRVDCAQHEVLPQPVGAPGAA